MRRYYASLATVVLAAAAVAQPVFYNATINLSHSAASGGCTAVTDMDNDGFDDIVQLDDSRHVYVLYQNPDHSFTTFDYGQVSNSGQWGWAIADVDNNGHKDVLSGGSYDGTHYLRITSRGVSDLSDLNGPDIFTQAMSIGDMNNDGRADVFACHDDGPPNIWFTDAGGVPVNSNSYIQWQTVCVGQSGDMSGNYGSTFTDFDNDHDIDLHISHCRQGVDDPDDCRRWDRLFVNDGTNQYSDEANEYGLENHEQVWTTDFGDYDNDGDLDVFHTTHSATLQLWENDGTGHYTDVTAGSGVEISAAFLQGLFRDLDNDGFLDIVTAGGLGGDTDHYFKGAGNGTFTQFDEVFPASKTMHSFAFGDLNGDGFEDLYASYGDGYINNDTGNPDRLWLNTPNGNHWLDVKLKGVQSNKGGVGAKVVITGPWGTQVREVHAGESYGIVNTFTCHFGLGANTTIPNVTIYWPSGIVDSYDNVEIDQVITVLEGACIAPEVAITTAGEPIVCTGGSGLVLDANVTGSFSYLWSTNEDTPSITVSSGGVYSVVVDDGAGCTGEASISVTQDPDETPIVTSTAEGTLCEFDEVTLTSSEADSYDWSTGATTQSITVSGEGPFSVTVPGFCGDFTSAPIAFTVIDAPEAPTSNGTLIPSGTSADLSATGTNVVWYDVPTGGTALATGNNWTTPILFSTTSYWCADQTEIGGEDFTGGQVDNSTFGDYSNSPYHLVFEAYEDMIIRTVKVYSDGPGTLAITIYDVATDQDVASGSYPVVDGENVVQVDLLVPEGGPYGIPATSSGFDLWRDDDGSDLFYPYALGDLGAITGTTVTGGNTYEYYYFFYDWHVERPLTACEGPRTEVVVEVSVGIEDAGVSGFQAYPVPTSAQLNLDFGTITGEVDVDVIDVTGRVMIDRHLMVAPNTQLDMSALATGEYTLRVRHDGGTVVRRITVR